MKTAKRLLLTLLLSLSLSGCGKEETKVPVVVSSIPLEAQMDTYRELIKTQQDEHGFIYTDECDSLLFTALAGIDVAGIDLTAARDANGKWYRTPAKDCYPERSKSSISRDMILGVMWYAWYAKDVGLANGLWDYGAHHSWIMGDGVLSRTVLSPAMVSTLAQLIFKLGGDGDYTVRNLPVTWPKGATDYEAHLQVLHILLRERIYDQLETSAEDALKAQAARQPQNALFRYAVGDTDDAIRMLLDGRDWPSERLPDSSNHCGRWLFERDLGPNWESCDDGRTHAGGDFLFLGHLLLKG